MPDALQKVEFSLSLDSDQLFQAIAFIDDVELNKDLASLASEGSGGSIPGMPMGMGSLMGGMGGGGSSQPRKMMIDPTSTKVIEQVAKEISEEGLFSVKADGKRLVLKLDRPTQFKVALGAVLDDAKKQLEVTNRAQSLKSIGQAMKAYQEKYKCLPPAGVVKDDGDGLPDQFNWRVGLLPFLDQEELYGQFDFSEAWDSEKNLAVAKKMPEAFAFKQNEASDKTRWHVVGGKIGLYQKDEAIKTTEIEDKKIHTAIVVESSGDDEANWISPENLDFDQVNPKQFGDPSENGVMILNAAFQVRIIERDKDKIQAVLSPAGKEKLVRTDFLPLALGN